MSRNKTKRFVLGKLASKPTIGKNHLQWIMAFKVNKDEEKEASKAVKNPGVIKLKKISQEDVAMAQGKIKKCEIRAENLKSILGPDKHNQGEVRMRKQERKGKSSDFPGTCDVGQLMSEIMAKLERMEKMLDRIMSDDKVDRQPLEIADEFDPETQQVSMEISVQKALQRSVKKSSKKIGQRRQIKSRK